MYTYQPTNTLASRQQPTTYTQSYIFARVKYILPAIAISAALLFIPYLGHVHLFDWDEINFAECSREMMVLNDYSRVYVNFQPFWEKPPMFFWMQSTCMHVFGVKEFAARLPNAICGIATLIILYCCGRRLYDHRFGLLWAMAYGGSLFTNMYFKSGIIDPWFNLFIFLSLYFAILYHWKRNQFDLADLKHSPVYYIAAAGLFMGLAILTKGQVALMLFIMTAGVYWLMNRLRFFFSVWHILLFVLASVLVMLTWYGYETAKNGPWFIQEFLKYQYRLFSTHDAGQKGFFGYHYVVILFGCFPASVIAIRSFFRSPGTAKYDRDFRKWMLILFWVVTILFTIVKSRIIHYSSMAWFPVTFLAAYTLYNWEWRNMPYRKWMSWALTFVGGVVAIAIIALPVVARQLQRIMPYVRDEFARANMEADVTWSGWESLIGGLFLGVIISGIIFLRKQQFTRAAYTLFGGTAIVIFLASAILVPKFERYSQGAAIDFYKERKGEDCYVHPLGYKTYAHLFYFQKPKPDNPNSYDQNWLLTGDIDKPVYFVTKVDRLERIGDYPELKELYRKNGFVFYKRDIPNTGQ
jgi:4-amino-4-deoxy-L-arabinose transferase-like glycosyltransferase